MGGEVRRGPEPEQFGAEVLGGQHVKGGEGLVHQQGVGLDYERPGESDALLHPAGELLGIGRFEAVEPDPVDFLGRSVLALGGRHALGLQADLDVLQHRQPGQQREGLEDHGDARVGAGDWFAAVEDLPRGRRDQAGDAPQQGALARPGPAEQGHDLPFSQVERDVVQHRQGTAVGGFVFLGDPRDLQDRLGLVDQWRGHRYRVRSAGWWAWAWAATWSVLSQRVKWESARRYRRCQKR